MKNYLILPGLVFCLMSCAVVQRGSSRPASFQAGGEAGGNNHGAKNGSVGPVTQAELQDDLLRFESQFNARIQSASQVLEASGDSKVRYRASLNRLIYGSNSLNIALGPIPESNLLDMIAFIELSQNVLHRHWIPEVFGTDGQALDQAFVDSRLQVWAIADKVMNPQQKNLLRNVISTWQGKHPDQIDVETVRLSAFSSQAGAKAAGLDQDVGGLAASVRQSTQAVDATRLFTERALYYAERAPFLIRLHAKLGVDEIMGDAGLSATQERTIRGLLSELQQTLLIARVTVGDANLAMKSVGTLMAQLNDNPRAANLATVGITQLSSLLKEWNHLLSSAPYQEGVSQMAGIANQLDRQSNQFLKKLAWIGAALIAFFWSMVVLSKLAYLYFSMRLFGRKRLTSRDEGKNKAA